MGKVSDYLITFAGFLPKCKCKILQSLQILSSTKQIITYEIPEDTSLNLKYIYITEIIPIEIFKNNINSIVKLIEKYKDRQSSSLKSKKELFEQLKSLIRKDNCSWAPIGSINLTETNNNPFIESISLGINTFPGSYIQIVITLTLKKEQLDRIHSIIKNDFKDKITLLPLKINNILKGYWGGRMTPGWIYKVQAIQNEIVKVKNFAVSILVPFFSGLLFKDGYMIPSIELWISKKPDLKRRTINENKKIKFNEFWLSVGVSPDVYQDNNNRYKLILLDRDLNDYSLKILMDESKSEEESFSMNNLSDQIVDVEYWIPSILFVWAIRLILIDQNDYLNGFSLKLFSKAKKFHKQIFKHIKQLNTIELQLNRIENTFSYDTFKIHSLIKSCPDFYAINLTHRESLLNKLHSNYKYYLEKVNSSLKINRNLLNNMLELHNIQTNLKTQKRLLLFTCIMAICTIFTTITLWPAFSKTEFWKCILNKKDIILKFFGL